MILKTNPTQRKARQHWPTSTYYYYYALLLRTTTLQKSYTNLHPFFITRLPDFYPLTLSSPYPLPPPDFSWPISYEISQRRFSVLKRYNKRTNRHLFPSSCSYFYLYPSFYSPKVPLSCSPFPFSFPYTCISELHFLNLLLLILVIYCPRGGWFRYVLESVCHAAGDEVRWGREGKVGVVGRGSERASFLY